MSSSSSSGSDSSSVPIHLCFFLGILFMFVGLSWYLTYESVFEGLFDQVKLLLIVSPLLLLLVVHFLSNFETSSWSLFFIPFPEQDSFHIAGGTPWGVGLLLVLLFFMISYQSDFRESWFPLLTR